MITYLSKKWRKHFNFVMAHPEVWLFAFFIVGNVFIDTYRFYLLFGVVFYILNIERFLFFLDPTFIKKTVTILLLFCFLNASLILSQKYIGRPVGLAIENSLNSYGIYADEPRSLYRPAGTFWDANLAATFLS